MARLPFIVEPRLKPVIDRIGNEDIGIIEIERRGYLTVQERNFVQQVQRTDQGANHVIVLSRKIATKYGISLERAYNVTIGCIGAPIEADLDLKERAEEEFAEDIASTIQNLGSMQAQSEIIEALCMLINRVDPDFDPGSGLQDVHPDLVSELSAFYRDELNKSTERIQELRDKKEGQVEEIEKKRVSAKKSG